jgi:hypothetical protein
MTQRSVLSSAAFLAVMAGLIYGGFNTGALQNADLAVGILIWVGVAVAHLVLGAIAGTSTALLLPVIVIAIAIPAGYGPSGEAVPIPLVMLWMEAVGLAFVAAGLGARKALGRRVAARAAAARSSPRSSG